MTDSEYTAIKFVVDRSGSMHSIKSDVEGGINAFIEEQANLPGRCTISIDQFDDVWEKAVRTSDVKSVEHFNLVPRGLTALLDAMGRSINDFGSELRSLPENQRPANVVVVVATDGFENASKEWTREKVFNLVKEQQDKYNWHFVFLAANQDAIQEGAKYGYAAASSLTYHPDSHGTQVAYAAASKGTSMLRSGLASSINFTEEDRDDAVASS